MKTHILRAPQTDRYGLQVPTLRSDLEDDISDAYRLLLSSVVHISGAAPQSAIFQAEAGTFTGAAGTTAATGTVVTTNEGFTLPTSGDLVIPIPVTGVYAINVTASWRSASDTGSGVGYATTTHTVVLATGADPSCIANFSGTIITDNKMGAATIYGSTNQASAIVPLTAGDTLTCGTVILSESPALTAAGLLASMTLSIVRIA